MCIGTMEICHELLAIAAEKKVIKIKNYKQIVARIPNRKRKNIKMKTKPNK